MLKGQAKTNYQREYMRRYRAGLTGSNKISVHPKLDPVLERPYSHWRPEIDADGNPIYEE